MRGRQRALATLIFLSFASSGATATPRCIRALGAAEDLPILAERLVELPIIAPLVARLWTDPSIPSHLKNVIHTGLFVQNARVVDLTAERRAELNLGHDFAAFYFASGPLWFVDARAMNSIGRSRLTNLIADWRSAAFGRRASPAGKNASVLETCAAAALGELAPVAPSRTARSPRGRTVFACCCTNSRTFVFFSFSRRTSPSCCARCPGTS